MPLILSPETETLIQGKVESGSYTNHDEVVVEALRLLEERDRLRELRASLVEAKLAIGRGEYEEWSPEFLERVGREAEELYRQGVEPDPDAWP